MGGNPISRIDPFGLDWYYNSSSGQVTEVVNGSSSIVGYGYAGNGPGLNNPAMQNVPNTGPLPQGTYTIGPQQDNGSLRDSMRLTPDPSNQMFGRGGFLMHGPHSHDRHDSSEGCPVLDRNIRDQIGDSGDNILHVYAPDPVITYLIGLYQSIFH